MSDQRWACSDEKTKTAPSEYTDGAEYRINCHDPIVPGAAQSATLALAMKVAALSAIVAGAGRYRMPPELCVV